MVVEDCDQISLSYVRLRLVHKSDGAIAVDVDGVLIDHMIVLAASAILLAIFDDKESDQDSQCQQVQIRGLR